MQKQTGRSISVPEGPSPIRPVDLDRKGGEKMLALMPTDIWKHSAAQNPGRIQPGAPVTSPSLRGGLP